MNKLLMILLLTSCGQQAIPSQQLDPELKSFKPVPIANGYRVMTLDYPPGVYLGNPSFSHFAVFDMPNKGECTIIVDNWLADQDKETQRIVISHEVGHCEDYTKLNYDHNGFTGEEGCQWGTHFCNKPEEAYAEAYSRMYLETNKWPNPREVKP